MFTQSDVSIFIGMLGVACLVLAGIWSGIDTVDLTEPVVMVGSLGVAFAVAAATDVKASFMSIAQAHDRYRRGFALCFLDELF